MVLGWRNASLQAQGRVTIQYQATSTQSTADFRPTSSLLSDAARLGSTSSFVGLPQFLDVADRGLRSLGEVSLRFMQMMLQENSIIRCA